jgi:hypothetical protein
MACANQIFLSLTSFIEKYLQHCISKQIYYKNICNHQSNDINYMSLIFVFFK